MAHHHVEERKAGPLQRAWARACTWGSRVTGAVVGAGIALVACLRVARHALYTEAVTAAMEAERDFTAQHPPPQPLLPSSDMRNDVAPGHEEWTARRRDAVVRAMRPIVERGDDALQMVKSASFPHQVLMGATIAASGLLGANIADKVHGDSTPAKHR